MRTHRAPDLPVASLLADNARLRRRLALSLQRITRPENPAHLALIERVARRYDLTPLDLVGYCRTAKLASARQTAMVLLHELHGLSSGAIGRLFGRHHATVLWAYQAVAAHAETEPAYAAELAALRRKPAASVP